MIWLRKLSELLSIDNVQELLVVGSLPEGDFSHITSRLGDFISLDGSISLLQCLRNKKPRVMVTLIGIGTEKGFLMPKTSTTLPESWWLANGYDIGLFAYSCHSAEYLAESEIRRHINSALGYEGKLWLSLETSNVWTIFIRRVREMLKKTGRIGNETYAFVQAEYSRLIRGHQGRGEVYLTQISLVWQSEHLRVIRGRTL